MKQPKILFPGESPAISTSVCHPQRLGLDMRGKTGLRRILLAAVFMLSVSACQQHDASNQSAPTEAEASTPPSLPSSISSNLQEPFEKLRSSLRPEYEAAKNQIQKSAIFNRANSRVEDFLSANGINVKNWNGKIEKIATSHGGGDAWIEVRSSGGASYRMRGIDATSMVYHQLASLSEGQRVIFSGSLQRTASGAWEASLTEFGSLQDPEYLISLTTIESAPSDISPMSTEKHQTNAADAAETSLPQSQNAVARLDPIPPEVLQLDPAEVALRTIRTPQDNGPQGACNLLTASLTLVAVEREHGVPLANSKRNIAKVLENLEVDEHDLNNWQEAAIAIHASSVSAGELEQVLRKQCKQLPQQ